MTLPGIRSVSWFGIDNFWNIGRVESGEKSGLMEKIMIKKLALILNVIFIALTFIGAGYILLNGGKVNAGYACVPMFFALISMSFYRKYK